MEIDLFLNYLQGVKRYSQHTILAYSKDLDQFFTYCRETELVEQLSDITPKMIRRWEMSMMEEGFSATSVKRKVSSLKTFFRYQEREGRVSKNPTEVVNTPKAGKRLPVFIDDDKMANLLDSSFFDANFLGLRDRLLLMLAYCTGMRRSELVGLQLSMIDLSLKVIRVFGKGNRQRVVPILDEVVDLIVLYRTQRSVVVGNEHDVFFVTESGLPLTPSKVYRIVVDYLSRVTSQTKRSPHTLRHSFATSMLNNGAPIEAIRELLGHTSLAATQVYTHNSFENLKKVFNQAHPRA